MIVLYTMIIDTVLQDPRSKSVPDSWVGLLRIYEEHLRAGGAPNTTIKTRLDHGRRLSRSLNVVPNKVTQAMLMKWLADQRWSLETRRSWNATLRGMWRTWVGLGLVENDPTLHLPRIKVPQHRPRPSSEPIYANALMRSDSRTWLILRLAHDVGLRRGEICLIGEWDLIDDLLGTSLQVHGKGGKTRVVPLTSEISSILRAQCREGGGWAFPGKIDGHLSAEWVGSLASEALQYATLHQGRHRFATRVLRKTGNLMVVKELLGHSSLATTQVYLEVAQDELRSAIEAVA